MKTRHPKTSTKRGKIQVVDTDEQTYLRMQTEFEVLTQELRQRIIHDGLQSSAQYNSTLSELEEQLIALDTEIISFLKNRPKLAKKYKRGKQEVSAPMPEADWRDKLLRDQEAEEARLIVELRLKQEDQLRAWQETETARLKDQERRLLDLIAERQARIEDEWHMHHRSNADPKKIVWLENQHNQTRQLVLNSIAQLKEESTARSLEWRKQARHELLSAMLRWREERNRLLQRLELDWREQEILHRQRGYLRRAIAEWRAEKHASE